MNLTIENIKKQLISTKIIDISVITMNGINITAQNYINMYCFISNTYYIYYNMKSYYTAVFDRFIIDITYFMFLSSMMQLKQFSDLVVADYPHYKYRFYCIYNILSTIYNKRYLLKVMLSTSLVINTITSIHPCASWFEREAWDMFGVFFTNNVDLRRILNDYGFNGHPLRKDFPLSGFVESSFDSVSGVIVSNTIKMIQEYRFFNINTPWDYYYLKNK